MDTASTLVAAGCAAALHIPALYFDAKAFGQPSSDSEKRAVQKIRAQHLAELEEVCARARSFDSLSQGELDLIALEDDGGGDPFEGEEGVDSGDNSDEGEGASSDGLGPGPGPEPGPGPGPEPEPQAEPAEKNSMSRLTRMLSGDDSADVGESTGSPQKETQSNQQHSQFISEALDKVLEFDETSPVSVIGQVVLSRVVCADIREAVREMANPDCTEKFRDNQELEKILVIAEDSRVQLGNIVHPWWTSRK